MFKLFNQGSKTGKTTNSTTNHNERETPGKQRDLILTNILEEGSSVDEPRSFEQDEQYLNECLQVLNGNSEEVVEEGDLEEYDFDDYNSVASTASLLNIPAEVAKEEKNSGKASLHVPSTHNTLLKTFQQRGIVKGQTTINGSNPNDKTMIMLPPRRGQNERSSRVQASISKVNNWSKLGSNLPSKDEWKEVFLEAAQTGDLRKMQEAYNKMGGTSEIVIRITDSRANTALHKAAQAGDLPCLQWLVERLPADCLSNINNYDNQTPLAVAIQHGHVKCVEWLLEETSAAEEVANDASRFLLMFSVVQHGQDSCLHYMLSYIKTKCFELDVSDNSGVTLAHVAAREGHMTCLQTLVDHNIDVTSEAKDGRTPAGYAYAAGQTGCARYLVMVESCWLLSVRVAKLHGELKESKAENTELKQKMEVLESRARSGLPDRPEAVGGGDQSDTNSTGTTRSSDGRLGTKLTDSPRNELGRANSSPDGESPKGPGHDRNVNTYQYHVNGTGSPENRPLSNQLNRNGMTVVNTDAEVRSARQFEALKQGGRLGTRGSVDSAGSGSSTPMSWSDMAANRPGNNHQVMAKQIAAVTRRLVMSKHAQKVEDPPLIRTHVVPVRTPVRKESPAREQLRRPDPSPHVLQTESYYSPSSSRSHSPSRTDSTSGSRPASGTPREGVNKPSSLSVKDDRNTTTEAKGVSPSRLRALANRRKTTTFSSDSTHSSDSDSEHAGQRTGVARQRRFYSSSARTQEHSAYNSGARRGLHKHASGETHRTKKSVSWNEAPRGGLDTNVNNQSTHERLASYRVPLELPAQGARTESRDNNVTGFTESNRRSSQDASGRAAGKAPVPSVVVHQTLTPSAEHLTSDSQSYSLDEYQLDERPWYETDEFD